MRCWRPGTAPWSFFLLLRSFAPDSSISAFRLRPVKASNRTLLIDQPRTIDRKRLASGPLTSQTAFELDAVERALSVVLGMPR